jgi:hypothetical protein
MPVVLIVLLTLLLVLLALVWRALRRARRADFIRQYTLPQGLFEKLRARHPQLTLKDCQLVAQALRQFFLAYLAGGRQPVAMPSQVVDDLWHEFILYTRHYDDFCRKAFGRFMHHTPAVALSSDQQNNSGLRRAWWYACKEENIDPRQPTRLPLLFALDTKLGIAGGFRYAPDCAALRATDSGNGGNGTVHCGGDFSSSSFDGGTDGFGDSGSSGDGGSSDGGCGGGGCGGGGD